MKIRILSLDPSLSNFGICEAMLDTETLEYNVTDLFLSKAEPSKDKRVRKSSDDLARCRVHADNLSHRIKWADMVVCEIPQGSQSARAMASYGACVGLIAAITKPLIQVTPTQVKVAATGSKVASKQEIIDWAVFKFPHANWMKRKGKVIAANEHLADAVAVIEAAIKADDFRMMMSAYNTSPQHKAE